MPRFVKALVPLHGTQSMRVTVDWRKGRIQRVRLEYGRPHLPRRLIDAMRR
jgi:hypothetical protein